MNRRGFILGALAAPTVIRTPGLLMPVKPRIQYPITIHINHTFVTPPDSAHALAREKLIRAITASMGVERRFL